VRRLITATFVLAVCAAALVLAGASGGGATGKTYKIEFDNAFGLTKGGDFRVGGVKAGKTSEFGLHPSASGRQLALVTAKVSEPGFDSFRKDATCDIKPQSLIGEYYVDCQPGKSSDKLKPGSTIKVSHTTSTIPQDLVNNILRRPYRERFRLIISELGTGLAGRPQDLAEVLRRAHPGLRETDKTLAILARQNTIIKNFIRDSDTVVAELENNKRDVARFVVKAADAAEITATRRTQLQATFHKLPGFLDELRPYMVRLGQLSDAQEPLLSDLQRAAPSLNTFLTRLGPFSEASRPAVRSLGKASVVGARAFRRGFDETRTLRTLAKDAPGTFKPLRQFLQTADDRRRAIDNDPRATINGPPRTDKTYQGGRGGFTGMESFWNYPFWQGLSINAFDTVGHVLRIAIQPGNDCLDGVVNTKEAANLSCKDWLGPDQPGITTPDFTQGGSTAAASRSRSHKAQPARKVGERRAPGQPDAGPVPGQRDISKPRITLPPGVKNLLKQLPGLKPDKVRQLQLLQNGAQRNTAPAPDQLLNFLLAP
jgi:virulence factor Mce-like protein